MKVRIALAKTCCAGAQRTTLRIEAAGVCVRSPCWIVNPKLYADMPATQAGMRRSAAQTLLGLVCAAALLARGAAAAAAALPAMGIPPGTGAWLGVSIDFGVYPRCNPKRLCWARWACCSAVQSASTTK